jgi:hypothetical protein
MTALSGGACSTRRITASSTTAPSTRPPTSAAMKPTQYDPAALLTL